MKATCATDTTTLTLTAEERDLIVHSATAAIKVLAAYIPNGQAASTLKQLTSMLNAPVEAAPAPHRQNFASALPLEAQLRELQVIASADGMYDAADFIKALLKDKSFREETP